MEQLKGKYTVWDGEGRGAGGNRDCRGRGEMVGGRGGRTEKELIGVTPHKLRENVEGALGL